MCVQNSSRGRRALYADRTAAEGGEFYALTELQWKEGSFFNFDIAAGEVGAISMNRTASE